MAALSCAALVTAAAAPHARQQAAATSPEELRAWLSAFSHDSMLGRMTGTVGHERAAQFIANELTRLAVAGAGDSGGYFRTVPLHRWKLDLARAELVFNNQHYKPGIDFLPLTGTVFGLRLPRHSASRGVDRLVGGRLGGPTSVTPSSVASALAVFMPPLRPNGQPNYQLWDVRDQLASYELAGAIVVVSLELMPRSFIARMTEPQFDLDDREARIPGSPPIIAVTRAVAAGERGSVVFESQDLELNAPARNVVAMVEGSDAQLKSEFVVLTAHSDALGIAGAADRIGADSVFNGADDGGSGSVALLALAKHFGAMAQKPKRSLVFVWTVAEEQGLLGAEYFADHPAVRRDAIVANITVGMIGRGGDSVSPLVVSGARRASTEFGDWIRDASARDRTPLVIDGVADEPARNAICASADWHFARWGIPSALISAKPSADYRLVTDDVAKIDFAKFARATDVIAAVAEDIANRPTRPRIDKPKPDTQQPCVQ